LLLMNYAVCCIRQLIRFSFNFYLYLCKYNAFMKNILLLTTSLANGGAERFVITHQKMLSDIGYKVYIVASNEIIELGEVNKDTYYTLYNDKALLNVMLKPYRLYKFIQQKKIDLIIDNRTRMSFLKSFIYKLSFGS